MIKVKRMLRQAEFQVFLFCLLFILVNWPFLAIYANKGLMSLFVSLFLLWAIFIALLFIIHRSLSRDDSDGTGDEERGG